jgi:checkpoint serine/threonine-protein kinase
VNSEFSPVKPKVIERRPPSPTVNTKAAMAEVFELFNQTLSVGRRGPTAIDENDEDDDSENDDDSDDDDDEEDDEDMKTHAVPPTPLPMPGTAPRLGMGLPTPSKIVPATPTPAQGYLSGKGKTPNVGSVFIEEEEELAPPTKPALAIFSDSDDGHQKPAVFSDENAPISVFADENAPRPNPPRLAVFSDENQIGTSKSDENTVPTSTLRTSVFGQTPMKTPLSVRPLAPVQTHSENTESPERQHSSVFIDQRFTTPLPSRRVFTSAPLESSKLEPADHEQHEAAQDGNMYSYQETLQDENSYNPNPRRIVRCGGAFDMMTPITERTCEYTQSTQAFTLRSSTSSALTQSQRRAMDEDDDFDDEEYQEQPTERDGLSMVQEESESAQVSRRNGLSSRETTPVVPFDEGTGGPASQRSNASDSLFQLSPGHTIHKSELPTAINTTEAISHPVEQKDPAMSHIVIPGQVNRSESRAPGDMSQELSMPATVAEPETIMHHPDKLMVPMQSLPSPTDEAVVSFNPPNPCCPTDPDVIQPMIAALSPPVAELNNFVDLRATRSEQLEDLQKNSKSRGRRNSSSTGTKGSATEPWLLNLHGRKFEIEEKVGEGGFGAVFKAIDLAARDAADDASDDEDDETNPEALYTLALKVEKPANVWEAVVLDRIRTRLPEEYHNSIVKSRGLYCYQDESILLLDYYNQGSLLDAVNKAVTWGIGAPAATAPGGLDETLAIFFTIELLRLVEALHRADFIHGDLKIDNCLIRLEESEGWTSQYEMTGENGWASKGIHLIDLGRAIDLRAYPAATAQTFIADWPVDAKDCQEMRDGRPWSYQTDYYGLASICYCMLFGKYISTELAPPAVNDGDQKRYKIVGSFKRVSLANRYMCWTSTDRVSSFSIGKRSFGSLSLICYLTLVLRLQVESYLFMMNLLCYGGNLNVG